MLMRRVIPCLDVRGGRVVKGVKFQGLRDAGDPAELAARYEAEGADELTLLDVSATPESRGAAVSTVAAVRAALGVPLTVGGGVRNAVDVARLLDVGADKVAVNTAATSRPELLVECAKRFGSQCIVIAIDAKRGAHGWNVVVRSGAEGTKLDAIRWALHATEYGAGEVLLTSWDRDGTREGYDLELLRAVCAEVRVPVIASGGASRPADLSDALEAGAEAVLAASIFHDGEYTVREVKQELAKRGREVRL